MKVILMIIVATFATPENAIRTVTVPVGFYDSMTVCQSQGQAAMRVSRPYAEKKAKKEGHRLVTQSVSCRDLTDVDYAPSGAGT
jgi:hypothetical protein